MEDKNLKLLEIAGFKQGTECYGIEGAMSIRPVWVHKESPYRYYEPLDLYNSLDALFKWLVPKVEESLELTVILHRCHGNIWACTLATYRGDVSMIPCKYPNPAHALAETILEAY